MQLSAKFTLGAVLGMTPLAVAQTPPPSGATDSKSVINYFQMFFITGDLLGQIIIIVLFLMSLFTIAYVMKLMIDYRRTTMIPMELHGQLQKMLAAKKFQKAIDQSAKDPSYLAKLVSSALSQASHGYNAMLHALEEQSDAQTSRMLRPIEYLNVIGNISPMMGLFGTVYGMIVAFQKLVGTTGRPEPQELAAGISTALVTTFWGLVVAIPALAGYALVRNKVDALTSDALVMAEKIIEPFKPVRIQNATSPSTAGARQRTTSKPDA